MTSRYSTTRISRNNSSIYDDLFKERGIKRIEQYVTPMMNHLTAGEIGTLSVVSHVWGLGDRFYKLSHAYYNDSRMWWVIAWFNRTPTEADVKIGYTIQIPLPLNRVISLLGL